MKSEAAPIHTNFACITTSKLTLQRIEEGLFLTRVAVVDFPCRFYRSCRYVIIEVLFASSRENPWITRFETYLPSTTCWRHQL